jgi:hypothetical protein
MAKKDDQPVLNHINKLVEEEGHLSAEGELTYEDEVRLAKFVQPRSLSTMSSKKWGDVTSHYTRHASSDLSEGTK